MYTTKHWTSRFPGSAPAGVDHRVQLYDSQDKSDGKESGAVVAVARLDDRGSAPLSERPILPSPFSSDNLSGNMARGPTNNPALWGGGYTFMNRVPGQPLFLVDPNSHFDPTKQLALNPKAWVEPPYGTFGASAPYFNDFRWQRQPGESFAFGRMFPIEKEGKYSSRSGRNSRTSSIACSTLAIQWRGFRRRHLRRLADGSQRQLERHDRPVVLRLRVCELGKRGRVHSLGTGSAPRRARSLRGSSSDLAARRTSEIRRAPLY